MKEIKEKIIEILEPLTPRYVDLPLSYAQTCGGLKREYSQESYMEFFADQLSQLFSQEKQKLVEGETERFKKYVLDNCSAGYKKYWAKIEKQLKRSGGNKS